MKVGVALSLLVGLGVLVAAQGCGGDDSSSPPAAPAGDDQVGKSVPKATGTPTTSTEERTYAVNTIALGEATRAGVKDANAWKQLGFNVDARVTNATSKDSPDLGRVCKLVGKASASTHQDGDLGIDNAFAKSFLPIIDFVQSTPSKTVTESVQGGGFTILIKVKGLTDDPAQTNTGLSGTLLVGAPFDPVEPDPAKKKKPTFTTADDWPYNESPQVALPSGFIENGVYFNGQGDATVELTLLISGQPLTIKINRAIVTFKHTADDSLDEGTIAGVANTEEFATGVASIAGRFGICEGTIVASITDKIREASDVMIGGAQNPAATCDGISVGIGFTAKRVANPTTAVAPAPAPPPACPGQ